MVADTLTHETIFNKAYVLTILGTTLAFLLCLRACHRPGEDELKMRGKSKKEIATSIHMSEEENPYSLKKPTKEQERSLLLSTEETFTHELNRKRSYSLSYNHSLPSSQKKRNELLLVSSSTTSASNDGFVQSNSHVQENYHDPGALASSDTYSPNTSPGNGGPSPSNFQNNSSFQPEPLVYTRSQNVSPPINSQDIPPRQLPHSRPFTMRAAADGGTKFPFENQRDDEDPPLGGTSLPPLQNSIPSHSGQENDGTTRSRPLKSPKSNFSLSSSSRHLKPSIFIPVSFSGQLNDLSARNGLGTKGNFPNPFSTLQRKKSMPTVSPIPSSSGHSSDSSAINPPHDTKENFPNPFSTVQETRSIPRVILSSTKGTVSNESPQAVLENPSHSSLPLPTIIPSHGEKSQSQKSTRTGIPHVLTEQGVLIEDPPQALLDTPHRLQIDVAVSNGEVQLQQDQGELSEGDSSNDPLPMKGTPFSLLLPLTSLEPHTSKEENQSLFPNPFGLEDLLKIFDPSQTQPMVILEGRHDSVNAFPPLLSFSRIFFEFLRRLLQIDPSSPKPIEEQVHSLLSTSGIERPDVSLFQRFESLSVPFQRDLLRLFSTARLGDIKVFIRRAPSVVSFIFNTQEQTFPHRIPPVNVLHHLFSVIVPEELERILRIEHVIPSLKTIGYSSLPNSQRARIEEITEYSSSMPTQSLVETADDLLRRAAQNVTDALTHLKELAKETQMSGELRSAAQRVCESLEHLKKVARHNPTGRTLVKTMRKQFKDTLMGSLNKFPVETLRNVIAQAKPTVKTLMQLFEDPPQNVNLPHDPVVNLKEKRTSLGLDPDEASRLLSKLETSESTYTVSREDLNHHRFRVVMWQAKRRNSLGPTGEMCQLSEKTKGFTFPRSKRCAPLLRLPLRGDHSCTTSFVFCK